MSQYSPAVFGLHPCCVSTLGWLVVYDNEIVLRLNQNDHNSAEECSNE